MLRAAHVCLYVPSCFRLYRQRRRRSARRSVKIRHKVSRKIYLPEVVLILS